MIKTKVFLQNRPFKDKPAFLPPLPSFPSIHFLWGARVGRQQSTVNEPGKRAVRTPRSSSWLWLASPCVTSRPQPEGREAARRCLWGTSCLSSMIQSGLRNCPGVGPSPQGGGVSEAWVLAECPPPRLPPPTGEILPQHMPRSRETGVMRAEEPGAGTRRRAESPGHSV